MYLIFPNQESFEKILRNFININEYFGPIYLHEDIMLHWFYGFDEFIDLNNFSLKEASTFGGFSFGLC